MYYKYNITGNVDSTRKKPILSECNFKQILGTMTLCLLLYYKSCQILVEHHVICSCKTPHPDNISDTCPKSSTSNSSQVPIEKGCIAIQTIFLIYIVTCKYTLSLITVFSAQVLVVQTYSPASLC